MTVLFHAYSKLRAETDSRRENVCVCVHVCALMHIRIPLLSIFPVLVVTLLLFSIKRVDKTINQELYDCFRTTI